MEEQLSFAAAIAAQRSAEVAQSAPAEPIENTPLVEQPLESAIEQPQDDQSPVAENTEQVAPSAEEPITFEKVLEGRGFDLSNVDREDLYKQAAERIVQSRALQVRLQEMQRELESLKAAQTHTSAAPQAPQPDAPPVVQQAGETPEQTAQRAFRELRPYDPQLNMLVTEDTRTGKFVPRPEFGQAGVDAARTINEYVRLERDQAAEMLRNPYRIVDDKMPEIEQRIQELAKKLMDERFQEFQTESQKREKELAAQMERQEQEHRWMQWHESNKTKIFRIGQDGQPLRNTFDDSPATTPVGAYFMSRLKELRADFPYEDPVKLQSLALREAELAVRPTELAPTPAQKRAALVQNQTSVPHQEVTPATSEELATINSSRLKFAEMAARHPEAAPIVNAWSKR
jgi:predicted house-cleaning noncanonical NTP pyrophosphatase (MazG superfamily)